MILLTIAWLRCHANPRGRFHSCGFAARRAFGVVVQRGHRLKHIIDGDQAARAWQFSQRRVRCHGSSIRRPGREDGALLVECEVGILHDAAWMPEGLGRVQEMVDVQVEWRRSW